MGKKVSFVSTVSPQLKLESVESKLNATLNFEVRPALAGYRNRALQVTTTYINVEESQILIQSLSQCKDIERVSENELS